MREPLDKAKLHALLEALGQRARGPGTVYLVGGATAVWEGWRPSSADVDLKLDPEPAGVFEAIRDLKEELHLNIELASPDDFLPAVPGWRERSRFVGRFGLIDVFHYDAYAQALAKIERGYVHDLVDVEAMVSSGLVTKTELQRLFEVIKPGLLRYPSVDVDDFTKRVAAVTR